MAKRATLSTSPSASSFDTRDLPTMGDPEFVENRVRLMFDEARTILFEAPNPQAAMPGLVDKWAKEFSPTNPAYIQTMSVAALNAFLRARGCGTDDTAEDAPLKAMLAVMLDRLVEAMIAFHEGRIDGPQLAFAIDTTAEDCTKMLQGLDNPAD